MMESVRTTNSRKSFGIRSFCVALILVLPIIFFYASKRIVIQQKAYAQIRAVPFVLEIHSYSFKDNPAGELFHKTIVARRSDAATVSISTVGPLSWGKTVKKLTFTDGERVTVFDLIRAKTSWHLRPSALATLKDRIENHPSDCVFGADTKFLRTDVLLNHPVVVVEKDLSEEHTTITRWMAPDLGCESLQFRYGSRQPDGSLKQLSESRLVDLRLGDPDPRLFDPAVNYEELRPSDAQSRYFQKLGLPEDDESKQSVERLDKKYATQHK